VPDTAPAMPRRLLPFDTALLRPRNWKSPVSAARALWFDYAHVRSAMAGRPVDAEGQPLPWYTYPAIEYLRQLDFSDKTVFEYGSGQSTLFWSAAANRVVSVEEDEVWHAKLAGQLPANCELILETDLARYPEVIRRFGDGFDVVVVDGAARGRTRLKCSREAIQHLHPGGLVILDNSDWLPESSRLLRESGLLQVDMTGFAPLIGHTQTTSLFFERSFVPKPKHERLPQPGPGADLKNWERLAPPEPPFVTIGEDTLGGVRGDRAIAFDTPEGERRFRVLAGHASGQDWSALVDDDQQRIVLYLTPGSDDPAEIERWLASTPPRSWEDLRAWVRGHHRRRYLL
jgi:hypothetical protein